MGSPAWLRAAFVEHNSVRRRALPLATQGLTMVLLVVFAILFAGDTHAQTNSPATGRPTISGAPQVGETLTADSDDISDSDGLGAFSYQWIRVDGGDTNISGATSGTYTLVEADKGKIIKVVVSFTDGGGTTETVASPQHPTFY